MLPYYDYEQVSLSIDFSFQKIIWSNIQERGEGSGFQVVSKQFYAPSKSMHFTHATLYQRDV